MINGKKLQMQRKLNNDVQRMENRRLWKVALNYQPKGRRKSDEARTGDSLILHRRQDM
jgi:hypothetical protein